MKNTAWQGAGSLFCKGASTPVGLLGLYFIINPFVIN